MHKEGFETYKDLIKYLFCFFVYLLDRISKLQLRIIISTSTCISPYSHNNLHDQLNYILTNKLEFIFAV